MEGRLWQEGWGRRNGAGRDGRLGQKEQGRLEEGQEQQAGAGGLAGGSGTGRAAGARGWVCLWSREPPPGAADAAGAGSSGPAGEGGAELPDGQDSSGTCRGLGPLWLRCPCSVSLQAAMDRAPPPSGPAGLSAYVAVSQLLGLALLGTTGAWLGRYRGGVAWHSPLQFNAHPLCMVLALVFLQGDGEHDRGTALSRPQPPEPAAGLGQGMVGTKG